MQTEIMNRRLVYGISLAGFMAATGMTIASIVIPEWISWDTETDTAKQVHYSYGLHSRCSSIAQTCKPFPRYADCAGLERSFCSLWRTTGFLMSFAVAIELATLVAFVVILLGGKQKRERGWRILVILLCLAAVCQIVGMGIISYLFEYDERFVPGWKLDKSWTLCTTSWCTQLLAAAGIVAGALVLPEEGGYELIPDRDSRRD